MPVYEYQCESCGKVFEVIQKFSDEPLTVHDQCGGTVHRLLSAPALQFKGSGWYITDYAKNTSAPATPNGKQGESKPGSSEASTPAAPSTESSSGSKTPPTDK
jgi:putative FmdB family regulatory protein